MNVNALKAAAFSTQCDKNYILSIVNMNGSALKHVGPNFQDDSEVVMCAIRHTGDAAKYASNRLRGDPHFMMEAFQKDYHALKYASSEIRNNPQWMFQALDISSTAVNYFATELKNNRQFMIAAMEKCACKDLLGNVSEQMQADHEFVMLCASLNGLSLEYAADELRHDRGIVTTAVQQNGLALKFASPALKRDREVVVCAVVQNGAALTHASEELRKDRGIWQCANRKRGGSKNMPRCNTAPAGQLKNGKKAPGASNLQNPYDVQELMRDPKEIMLEQKHKGKAKFEARWVQTVAQDPLSDKARQSKRLSIKEDAKAIQDAFSEQRRLEAEAEAEAKIPALLRATPQSRANTLDPLSRSNAPQVQALEDFPPMSRQSSKSSTAGNQANRLPAAGGSRPQTR